jgi:single-stranded-DNA-specific exonuclease
MALVDAACSRGAIPHLVWGEPERAFALACWRERLHLRPALVELWRALDSAGELAGEQLDRALRGTGQHPRYGSLCGRLVRVLTEVDLAAWESGSDGPRLVRCAGERTDLDRSAAHRAYAARLAEAERYLAPAGSEEARKAG